MSNSELKQKQKASDYEVGYSKPPKSTQFKKGASGNPSGRPKCSINASTVVQRVFNTKIPVHENGQRQMKSKFEVSITQLANKAATGDEKATRAMLQLLPLMSTEENGVALTPDLVVDRELALKVAARMANEALKTNVVIKK